MFCEMDRSIFMLHVREPICFLRRIAWLGCPSDEMKFSFLVGSVVDSYNGCENIIRQAAFLLSNAQVRYGMCDMRCAPLISDIAYLISRRKFRRIPLSSFRPQRNFIPILIEDCPGKHWLELVVVIVCFIPEAGVIEPDGKRGRPDKAVAAAEVPLV